MGFDEGLRPCEFLGPQTKEHKKIEGVGVGIYRPAALARVYTTAVAISLLIFYAFAMQCMSTLAVTLKETRSWKWTMVMLVYLTVLAYVASLVTYQLLA